MPSRKLETFPTNKNHQTSKERTDLREIQSQAFLTLAESSDKEWIANCHHMLHQDGIDHQSSSSPREFTVLNQICGASAAFSESAFHSPTNIANKDSDNFKKESCSQEQAASQFLHAASLIKMARNQLFFTRRTNSSRSLSKWAQNLSKISHSSQMRPLLNMPVSLATDPFQTPLNKNSNIHPKK